MRPKHKKVIKKELKVTSDDDDDDDDDYCDEGERILMIRKQMFVFLCYSSNGRPQKSDLDILVANMNDTSGIY